MTDKKRLKTVIEKSGLKISFIAEQLGISRAGLFKKLNNDNEFKVSEVYKMQKILGMSDKDRDSIFFANCVE